MDKLEDNVSDQLVRLVQIIFGFVLAQGLGRYEDVILNPLSSKENIIKFFALLAIYLTVILSWIDWHITMKLRPYYFRNCREQIRLIADVAIVCLYAIIIFSIKDFSSYQLYYNPRYFLVFACIFIAYLFSGKLRQATYGSVASRTNLIGKYLFIYLILFIAYYLFYARLIYFINVVLTLNTFFWINIIFISFALVMMVIYRHERRKKSNIRLKGLKIGIDVDGVLANQIEGLIPRIHRRLGILINYDKVTEWNLNIGNSSIDKEIEVAMKSKDYVISMPSHAGASEVINDLYKDHRIIIITSRPKETENWTKEWLIKEKIPFDKIETTRSGEKSLYATDILIDDYLGNVKEFLAETNGHVILVDQPWNRNRDELKHYIDEGWLYIVNKLSEVPSIIRTIEDKIKNKA